MSEVNSQINISRKSSIFSFGNETVRLENEINHFTRKLEHERRLSLLLDKDLKEIKQSIVNTKKSRSQKFSTFRAQDKVKALEIRLEAANKQLGEIRGKTRKLVNEIDCMRKNAQGYHIGNLSAKKELERARSQIIETNRFSTELQKTIEKYNENILNTHSKFENNRDILAGSLSLMKSNYLEDKIEGTRFRQGFTVNFAQPIADASEMHGIYKNQAQKWSEKCKKSTSEREKIRSRISEMSSAMEEMKAQSKLSSLKELEELFTTSINEHSKLSHYFYTISEEVFEVSEKVRSNKEKVEEISQGCNKEIKIEEIEAGKENLKEIEKQKEIVRGKLEKLRENINILPNGFNMINEELLNLGMHHEFELPDLDEDTVTKVMFELEESINSVMYWRKITVEQQKSETSPIKQKIDINEVDIEKLIEEDLPNIPMTFKDFQIRAINSLDKLSEGS